MKQIVFLFILVFASNLLAQDKPAYVIYTKSGKKTTYSKMIKAMESKKAIFFGELHDNPIAHW
ncbi:MAG: iron-regulated protein, partial [Flavobacteriia bacterium]